MATRTASLLRLPCPECGKLMELQLSASLLEAAVSSASGLVGLADYHGDHVVVVYVDGEGRDRGIRVYKTLQRGEEVRINPSYLNYMNRIRGFRLSASESVLECFLAKPEVLFKISRDEAELELELSSYEQMNDVINWCRGFLQGLERAASRADPGTLLLSILVLDACFSVPPPRYSSEIFETALKSKWLLIDVDEEAMNVLSSYLNRLSWIQPHVLEWAGRLRGKSVMDAILAADPVTIRERLLSLLSLKRRGVVKLMEVVVR